MIELDIRKTSDGYYVLCHDDNIYRTTTVTGKSPDELKVANMTLAQIHEYNLLKGDGEYYSETLLVVTSDWKKSGQGTSYKMPTLQEVFNVIKNTNVVINFDGDDAWNNKVAICNLATDNGCPLSLLMFKRNTSLSTVTTWLNSYSSNNRPRFCLTLSKTTLENTISDINTFGGVATMVELSFNNFASTPSSATIQSVTELAKSKRMRVMYVCDFNSGDNSTIWAEVVANGYNAIMTDETKMLVEASY